LIYQFIIIIIIIIIIFEFVNIVKEGCELLLFDLILLTSWFGLVAEISLLS
jgi:hypothetical protein